MREYEITRAELVELADKLEALGKILNEKETVLLSGLFGLSAKAIGTYFRDYVNTEALAASGQGASKTDAKAEDFPEVLRISLPDYGEVVKVDAGFKSTFYGGSEGGIKRAQRLDRKDPYLLGPNIPIQCIE
ncbi:hypothetical protein HF265_20040 [Rhizobium leguminosarum]|uniref:hypothetical protein n=1 Tax=Rhizobium leguminosarum TaxID=384 RepID=UPI0003727FE2|nr:hypothetical protein [Rhizobium leguminosarum]MBY3031350.1 hypothetical protein [Rhizobium leguminosarum]